MSVIPIPGHTEERFSDEACIVLSELAKQTDGLDGAVVEVGSWTGHSTTALAKAVFPYWVHAVDTWQGSPLTDHPSLTEGRDLYGQFLINMWTFCGGNVRPYPMDWRVFFSSVYCPTGIRLLFLDAEHTYREVRENIEAAMPLMVPGGIICGDDVYQHEVRNAVQDTLPDAVIDNRRPSEPVSMWWMKC